MHNHERAGQLIVAGAAAESVFEDIRIQVPGGVVAIQKYAFGAQVTDRVATCSERKRWAEHFVVGTDSEQAQAQVNRSGPAAQRSRGKANALLERVFERDDV